jgi:hypothetical protein
MGLMMIMIAFFLRSKRHLPRIFFSFFVSIILMSGVGSALIWAQANTQQLQLRQFILDHLAQWPQNRILFLYLPEPFVEKRAPILGEVRLVAPAAMHVWTGDENRKAYFISRELTYIDDQVILPEHMANVEPTLSFPYERLVLANFKNRTFLAQPRASDFRALPYSTPLQNPFASWAKQLYQQYFFDRRTTPRAP